MTNYTRTFHNKTISVTSQAQLKAAEAEAQNLARYIDRLENDVEDYTRKLKEKLAGVADSCRPSNLAVNNQAIDGVVEALSKELDVLRADYEDIIFQIKQESKRYLALKQESYTAYKQYLAEQLSKKENGILNTDNRTHIPG